MTQRTIGILITLIVLPLVCTAGLFGMMAQPDDAPLPPLSPTEPTIATDTTTEIRPLLPTLTIPITSEPVTTMSAPLTATTENPIIAPTVTATVATTQPTVTAQPTITLTPPLPTTPTSNPALSPELSDLKTLYVATKQRAYAQAAHIPLVILPISYEISTPTCRRLSSFPACLVLSFE